MMEAQELARQYRDNVLLVVDAIQCMEMCVYVVCEGLISHLTRNEVRNARMKRLNEPTYSWHAVSDHLDRRARRQMQLQIYTVEKSDGSSWIYLMRIIS